MTISGLTVSNYEKSGLKIDGNIAFTADHLDIGAAAASDGTPLTSLAANGVTIVRSARGSLTDSTIGQNRYSTDDEDPTGEHTPATSVLLYDADGDTGIAINNFSNTIDTIASFTCNAITRTDGGNADSDFGDAIYNDTTSTDAVNLTVGSNTYSGWTTNVYGPATTSPDPTCTTSTTATPSTSTVTSGHAITVTGAVTNTDGSAAPGGTATLLKRESGVSGFSAVATKTTRTNGSYVFRTTPEQGTSYKVSFSKPRFTDSTSPAFWVAVAPAVTIHATPKNLNRGGSVSFTGTSSPAMAGHNVSLMQYSAKAWHVVDTGTLTEEGGYTFTWTAAAKGSPVFQVRVEKAAGFLTGISPNVTLKVS
jgi:hypothetical protein